MTSKTKKELQAENISLKEELANIKEKFAELSEKYKKIEQNNQISLFQCKKCHKSFVSSEDLKKHMRNHADRNQIFKCDECDLEFNEEWKILAHKRRHVKFKCGKCEKSFKNEILREKHVKISHQSKILYCHYFNNHKQCPYEENCIFMHKDSELCKYGNSCERILCMYKHRNEETLRDITANDKSDINTTFQNPYLLEKFECENCSFVTTARSDFEEHTDEGKRHCNICDDDYFCIDNLKSHLFLQHKMED